MPSGYKQCKGITSKGVQCKINAPDGYCHYHVGQGEGKRQKSDSKFSQTTSVTNPKTEYRKQNSRHTSPTKETDKNGYIYVYTLTRLLANDDKNWSLKVRNLPDVSSKHRDTWVPFKAEKSPYMLIKVGMTTQTVQRRLKQWEDKCHHLLTCLRPRTKVHPESKISLLIQKFKKLSVSTDNTRLRCYRDTEFGFFCPKGVNVAEIEIHKRLVAKYGSGDVFCTGCTKSVPAEHESIMKRVKGKLSTKDPFQNGFNIHVEWFLIPKKDLDLVYQLIDSVCAKYYD